MPKTIKKAHFCEKIIDFMKTVSNIVGEHKITGSHLCLILHIFITTETLKNSEACVAPHLKQDYFNYKKHTCYFDY